MLFFILEGHSLDLMAMWGRMGVPAKLVVVILFIMSMWSLGVMIDRFLAYKAARNQSKEFVGALKQMLGEGKIEESIVVAKRYPKSHLAKVVAAGLNEFLSQSSGGDISGELIESTRRALDRATAITLAELKRGTPILATAGATAPFVGLFGTTLGIINAFAGMSKAENTGIGAVAGGISEALVTTAFGLLVAVPAVWMFNYCTGKIEAFTIEMDNSSSELVDYFIKRRALNRG